MAGLGYQYTFNVPPVGAFTAAAPNDPTEISQTFRVPDAFKRMDRKAKRRRNAVLQARTQTFWTADAFTDSYDLPLKQPLPQVLRRHRKTRRLVANITRGAQVPTLLTQFFKVYEPQKEGVSGIIIHKPDFTSPTGIAGVLAVHSWKTHRYQNRVGDFEVRIPVDDGLISNSPLSSQIRRGWRISIVQENNRPLEDPLYDYLMYQGKVIDREYEVDASGAAMLVLRGNLRTVDLAERVNNGVAYTSVTPNIIADSLAGGTTYMGSPGGALYPPAFSSTPMTIAFDQLTRYAEMLRLAEVRRSALRESWDYDKPQFVQTDNPPSSGYILTQQEYFDPSMFDSSAQSGFAWIADKPRVRYLGQRLANRIIAVGSDTPDGDLKLNSASTASPYTVLSRTKANGQLEYYVEDTQSIARYGAVELYLVRTDVKNPSDNAATRQAAANVLYAIAVGELLRRKAEMIEVTVPVANGAHVWALPGDSMRLQYTGVAEASAGGITFLDEDRIFLVSERIEQSDPSGVRQVSFVLVAPEINMYIPDLPDTVILPPTNTGYSDPYDPWDGGDDWGPGTSEDCCDDPTTDDESGPEIPPPDIIMLPVAPPPGTIPTVTSLFTPSRAGFAGQKFDINANSWSAHTGANRLALGQLAFRGARAFYVTSGQTTLARTLDVGVSWDTVAVPNSFASEALALGPSPSGGSRLWLSSNNAPFELYYSDDDGANWTLAYTHGDANDAVYQFAPHPTDSNRVVLFYANLTGAASVMAALRTVNAGSTWATVDVSALTAEGFPHSVWMENLDRLLVTYSHGAGLGDGAMYYSDDDGATWTLVEDLVGTNPKAIAYGDGYAFLGYALYNNDAANNGTFRRSTDGVTWEAFIASIPDTLCYGLVHSNGQLWALTTDDIDPTLGQLYRISAPTGAWTVTQFTAPNQGWPTSTRVEILGLLNS
jgi:hypothetical protein